MYSACAAAQETQASINQLLVINLKIAIKQHKKGPVYSLRAPLQTWRKGKKHKSYLGPYLKISNSLEELNIKMSWPFGIIFYVAHCRTGGIKPRHTVFQFSPSEGPMWLCWSQSSITGRLRISHCRAVREAGEISFPALQQEPDLQAFSDSASAIAAAEWVPVIFWNVFASRFINS